MRTAETILNIIRERGQRGLPVEDVYRLLYNPDLYLRAYAKLNSNAGAMTPGSTKETVDGMSLEKINAIIETLRSEHSHGFRAKRGCHTALKEITQKGRATKWFIEGDISACFDSIDHTILLKILLDKIHDNRFIRLINGLLDTGHLENWKYNATYSGVPQGGVVSPILSNLVLDKLDKYVEREIIPAYTRGLRRSVNPPYNVLTRAASKARKAGKLAEARQLSQQAQSIPSRDPNDPDFRRLWYVRYADDFLLGVVGSKSEALDIKQKIATFLRDELKLELSEEKTLVTHARDELDDNQTNQIWNGRSEVVQRLLAQQCEICGATDNIEVHHIRKLADLKQKGCPERPEWMVKMSARQRKTLVVCRPCHEKIQYGRYDGDALKRKHYRKAT